MTPQPHLTPGWVYDPQALASGTGAEGTCDPPWASEGSGRLLGPSGKRCSPEPGAAGLLPWNPAPGPHHGRSQRLFPHQLSLADWGWPGLVHPPSGLLPLRPSTLLRA